MHRQAQQQATGHRWTSQLKWKLLCESASVMCGDMTNTQDTGEECPTRLAGTEHLKEVTVFTNVLGSGQMPCAPGPAQSGTVVENRKTCIGIKGGKWGAC